jgi:hypothetical protein
MWDGYGVTNCTLRSAGHFYILNYCFKILISHDMYFAGHVCRFGKALCRDPRLDELKERYII